MEFSVTKSVKTPKKNFMMKCKKFHEFRKKKSPPPGILRKFLRKILSKNSYLTLKFTAEILIKRRLRELRVFKFLKKILKKILKSFYLKTKMCIYIKYDL